MVSAAYHTKKDYNGWGCTPLESVMAVYKMFADALGLGPNLFFIPAVQPDLRSHP